MKKIQNDLTPQNDLLSESSLVQQQLEKEFSTLADKVRLLSISSKEWLKGLKELNTAVKESGDVTNYADIIATSVREICEVLGNKV
jgi:D-ribose pyranose/furanose isomerase RbsD